MRDSKDPLPSSAVNALPDAKRDTEMPAEWAELPESSDPRPDVLWAYNNQMHIEWRSGQDPLIYWGRMSAPPSRAASAQIRFFANNTAKFQERLDKAFGQSDATDPELVKEEQKSIAQVRRVLAKFKGKKDS